MFFLAVSGIYSILASYLESILTFFLTVFLAFYLASAICSDILSGRLWCSDPGVAHSMSWRCGVRVQACPAASGADRGDQDNNEAEEEEEEENKEKELHLC